MSGHGPAPKAQRRNKADVPLRGEWQASPGIGWQHGDLPPLPAHMLTASRIAWKTWFHAWFASHWTPDDVPALRQIVRLYDQVERGEYHRASELRLQMDTYGITPKGQQDRRWAPPKADEQAPAAVASGSQYAGLRVVGQ